MRQRQVLMISMERDNVRADVARMTVSGDLDGDVQAGAELDRAFADLLARRPAQLIVNAEGARLLPEGVEAWIRKVSAFCGNVQDAILVYVPSHLALVLKYDPRYTFKTHVILDDA
jgi:hypothetical protein